MKLPKLQQLKYLVSLHDTGHFGQAAKKCFVSQSTLSSAIQSLEEQLNSQLIERDHKTFVFTPLGLDVVQKSRGILEQSADLVAMASSDGNEMSGELHIGIIPTVAPFVLSPLIQRMSLDMPNLQLFIREDTTENCLAQLREGRLDLVLMATPYETKEFAEKVLINDPFYRIYHPEQKEQGNSDIYLLEKEHCLTDHAIKACKLMDSKDIHPFQASSLNTLLAMVQSHLAETYLPKLAINSGLLSGTGLKFEQLNDDSAYRELSLVWRKTSHRRVFYSKVSDSLENVLKEVLS